jgi:hypothetical protein
MIHVSQKVYLYCAIKDAIIFYDGIINKKRTIE